MPSCLSDSTLPLLSCNSSAKWQSAVTIKRNILLSACTILELSENNHWSSLVFGLRLENHSLDFRGIQHSTVCASCVQVTRDWKNSCDFEIRKTSTRRRSNRFLSNRYNEYSSIRYFCANCRASLANRTRNIAS